MRTIEHHLIREANTNRTVCCIDEPDPKAGGACHEYVLGVQLAEMRGADAERVDHPLLTLKFQHGPIKEVGDNGVADVQLYAVIIDRLRHFQAGPFADKYNADSLRHLEAALDAQHQRTRDRVARGVEGLSRK